MNKKYITCGKSYSLRIGLSMFNLDCSTSTTKQLPYIKHKCSSSNLFLICINIKISDENRLMKKLGQET